MPEPLPDVRQGTADPQQPPAPGHAALLIIDMVNDMAFEGADAMAPAAIAAAQAVARLRAEADALGVPVVYVNDNYGLWHSERSKIVDHCRRRSEAGRRLVEAVGPRESDYFVVKPQVSGFYATNLPVLLPKLGVQRLALTGVAADICVLFTAADAHMRDYRLWAPADAVASCREEHRDWALQIMAKSMAADIRPTTELRLGAWVEAGG
jgi:nicotinamidase-related amidase